MFFINPKIIKHYKQRCNSGNVEIAKSLTYHLFYNYNIYKKLGFIPYRDILKNRFIYISEWERKVLRFFTLDEVKNNLEVAKDKLTTESKVIFCEINDLGELIIKKSDLKYILSCWFNNVQYIPIYIRKVSDKWKEKINLIRPRFQRIYTPIYHPSFSRFTPNNSEYMNELALYNLEDVNSVVDLCGFYGNLAHYFELYSDIKCVSIIKDKDFDNANIIKNAVNGGYCIIPESKLDINSLRHYKNFTLLGEIKQEILDFVLSTKPKYLLLKNDFPCKFKYILESNSFQTYRKLATEKEAIYYLFINH